MRPLYSKKEPLSWSTHIAMFCCGIGLYMLEWALCLAYFILVDSISPKIAIQHGEFILWVLALPSQTRRYFDLEPRDAYGFATIVMYGMLNYFAIRYCWNWYWKRKHRTDVQKDYDDATQTSRRVS